MDFDLRALTKKLAGYGLTKAEVLMCVNLRVRELGLLDCVVEEMDERVGEGEGQEGLLGVLGGVFGSAEGEEGGEGEG